ncbi:hypothetical protein [Mesorhizobium sp. M8A.F.Ca.ET.021.01.1.1]|uniref:hypothetical protein n=1 Tax=Mesorhizobium sp. M8A.F.Ca.ET.021.01.1.1 TaxID=2496757 RepID=UPI000FC9EF95|nr:hypothetical protein [Mesorhizobium sp. M8A.F.Ca.ET.021.01.1.1]RUW56840.1 hypothetical protein EOA36_02250 [Mesorhizobium sp. M8A.F.Ca.ET.021.01.1.1]
MTKPGTPEWIEAQAEMLGINVVVYPAIGVDVSIDQKGRVTVDAVQQTDEGLIAVLPIMIDMLDRMAKEPLPHTVRDLLTRSKQVHEHAQRRLTELLKDEANRRWGEESNFS